MNYIVLVPQALNDPQELSRKLVQTGQIKAATAAKLIGLMPGAVTKPIPEQNALRICSVLNQAGVITQIQPVGSDDDVDVRQTQAGTPRGRVKPLRVSLRTKYVFSSVFPTLLTIGAALAAVLLTVQPALRNQLLASASNPAQAYANTIAELITDSDLASPSITPRLQAALDGAKETLREENVSFTFVTDADGDTVAGWYEDVPSLSAIPEVIDVAVQTQTRRAAARSYAAANDIRFGTAGSATRRVNIANRNIEVVAQSIDRDDESVGAVIIGVTDETVRGYIASVLRNTFAIGSLPVLLALALALGLAGSLTRNILYLIRASEDISRGDFSQQVSLKSNDELGDLGRAIERMRVSLEESISRLRKRRA